MSGIFGVVSKGSWLEILLHGSDYHSHVGTQFGGVAVLGREFTRQIHDISQSQFKSKFYQDYKHIKGNKGIGVISALEEQPIYLNSKFGPFCLATNGIVENVDELAARNAIRALEGHDLTDVSAYLDSSSAKYRRMVEWIAKDLGVTTLRYQTVEDMVKAIGLRREKLCLYCWTGECPKAIRPGPAVKIVEIKKRSHKRQLSAEEADQRTLW